MGHRERPPKAHMILGYRGKRNLTSVKYPVPVGQGYVTEEDVRRERNKMPALRRTEWWQEKRQVGLCHYCKKTFLPEQITMDHVVPLAAGGRSVRENIVPSCYTCNVRKGANLPPSAGKSRRALRRAMKKRKGGPRR